jgi:SAM-dependent methyltransferase
VRDLTRPYPANYFRLQKLLTLCERKNIDVALEVGVGDGTPLAAVAAKGVDVWGFDLAVEMVRKAREKIVSVGGNPGQIFMADIEDHSTYERQVPGSKFDALIAMGVMPHIERELIALENMSALLKPGGTVFVEFRNKLFNLFTFNRKTVEFIVDELLVDVSKGVKQQVSEELSGRLRMDMPPVREKVANSNAPGYDAILSKYHNPFEVVEIFKSLGYKDIDLHWYHYHPAMPYLEGIIPQEFRENAIAMEHETSGWRGYFLASAFVVEAVKE